MNKFFKRFLVFLILNALILGGTFLLGVYYGKSKCRICPPEDIDFSLFWEAYRALEDNFIDNEKLTPKEIVYGAIEGMVKTLKDPYTNFFTPQKSKKFIEEEIKGMYEGVGMYIGIRDNQLQVISPIEGTPAYKAGLRAGDKILFINGTSTEGITLEEAANLIKGPRGTEVTLTILREEWEEPRDFKIKRARITIPVVKWEVKENNIAYIKIFHFTERTDEEFNKISFEILNSPGIDRIILDLRNNPGGLLSEVIKISGYFLKRGDPIVIIKEKDKEIVKRAKGNERFLKYPLVVLINKGTASGAEILASALRENLRAKFLIGETSFGKGLVQEPIYLSDNSLLKITTSEWLTSKGKAINKIGVKPDIEIEMKEEDYREGKDPQLEEAIKVIKKIK